VANFQWHPLAWRDWLVPSGGRQGSRVPASHFSFDALRCWWDHKASLSRFLRRWKH
jgi:hypothetical protein